MIQRAAIPCVPPPPDKRGILDPPEQRDEEQDEECYCFARPLDTCPVHGQHEQG
jgi:hypothetical protein